MEKKVREFTVKYIYEHFNKKDIDGNLNLETDIGFDSIDIMEIMMAIEDEFDVDVVVNEFKEVDTINKIVSIVIKDLSS